MRTAYCQEMPDLTFKQHPPSSKPIQCHPSEHEPRPKASLVFQKNDEVVSEVQIGLERLDVLSVPPPKCNTLT